jgi:hypothetical protein
MSSNGCISSMPERPTELRAIYDRLMPWLYEAQTFLSKVSEVVVLL